jgi:hypothetical protein
MSGSIVSAVTEANAVPGNAASIAPTANRPGNPHRSRGDLKAGRIVRHPRLAHQANHLTNQHHREHGSSRIDNVVKKM